VPPAPRPGLCVDRLRAVHAARRRPGGPLGGHRQHGVRDPRLMDPLVVLFGFGVGILIGLTGVDRVPVAFLRPALGCVLLGSALGVLTKAGLDLPAWTIVGVPAAVGAAAWLVHRLQFRKAPVAA